MLLGISSIKEQCKSNTPYCKLPRYQIKMQNIQLTVPDSHAKQVVDVLPIL